MSRRSDSRSAKKSKLTPGFKNASKSPDRETSTLPPTKGGADTPPRASVPQGEGDFLTTNQGVRLSDNHNSLKAGPRGPTLLDDFVLREKLTSFDHERIPERVVHARGAGAFGYFECTKSMKSVTSAGLFATPGKRTPVFLRFSTVAGSRGSADTARDVRGFAVKFYSDEGNWDLVGNNIPVFFIQDAMKFPDLVHAVKPEPHNEIPQAASAHDTFWDFVSLMPESTHMLLWVMSDRAIPRSYRMMEGFGVHTFRFVDAAGKGTFVKFHWKPRLGIHGLTWEESLNLAGQDPDFHRRDLWENIAKGAFPEWDLGVQLVPEEDEFKYEFDLLDPTKLIPEELVPVEIIGRLVLDRNPKNFFAEVEQVAFQVGNLIPGIDVTNDPLLQGRLFSYLDTQLIRLGGPNFHQIPVNRPLAPVHHHQRDGFGQQAIPEGRVAYEPNSLGGGCPFHSPEKMKSFVHFTERVDAHKVRARSASFGDHFSQARLFYLSQTPEEQGHIRDAFSFELSKVETLAIRERMVATLALVDEALAGAIAAKVGVRPERARARADAEMPSPANPENDIVPPNRATATARADEPAPTKKPRPSPKTSDALSMVKSSSPSLTTRKIAFLVADGVEASSIATARAAIEKAGGVVELIGPRMGEIQSREKKALPLDKSFDIATALHYDAVFVPAGGASAEALVESGPAIRFVAQAFKHGKAVGAVGEGRTLIDSAASRVIGDWAKKEFIAGTDAARTVRDFIQAASRHRDWAREARAKEILV